MHIRIFLCALCCCGVLYAYSQAVDFYVRPVLTHQGYAVQQDSHHVQLDPSISSLHTLLVFLPGTGADTKNYTYFPELAASLGYHAVSLAYPNGFPSVAQSCAGDADPECYEKLREEVCYGTPASNEVNVDSLNSIRERLVNLLNYLIQQYPSAGWDEFLSGQEPVWSRIAFAGHSQGSGHALYFGKTRSCARVLMFAGANDYSNYTDAPAGWVSGPFATDLSLVFSFLHLRDEVWDYEKQYAVLQSMGMTANGDDSTLTDPLMPPYANSHCLYTNINPRFAIIYSAFHNGMVVDFYTPLDNNNDPLYMPVWTYMLTANLPVSEVEEVGEMRMEVFPNPAEDYLYVRFPEITKSGEFYIYNVLGELLQSSRVEGQKECMVDISGWEQGIYFIRWNRGGEFFVKQ